MPYYGHRLFFGTLLDPVADAPEDAVELARLSESLGYDAVVLRDEPNRADLLDAWTTLTWIAGKTERIWLGALVGRLHRRLPAVIGRQIASLDLLSNGRAELAFGPVESLNEVDALDEAIDIVRAILDVSEPGTVALDGRHFPIMGAQRGPLPHHTIPIWLSGSAMPLLELAGRTADGWIGTPDELPLANAVLDVSAIAAGRDPSEISRIVVVQADDALLPLVLDAGRGNRPARFE